MTIPPSIQGLTLRPPTIADIPALGEHGMAISAAERTAQVYGPEFFTWLFGQPSLDISSDMLLGIAPDGTVVADAGSWARTGDDAARAILWAETQPGWEDAKLPLLEWAEQRAHEQLAGATGRRTLRSPVEDHRTAHREAVEAAGFRLGRTFVEMERPLADLPETPPPPPGIEFTTWSPDRDEKLRLASNATFADHWGSLPLSPEEWVASHAGASFSRDLSLIALDQGAVVSFCLSEVDAEQNASTGIEELWISSVGTVPTHRRRGLASALIVEALQRGRTAGLTSAGLSVDEVGDSNAIALYRRLGFTDRSRMLQYTKEI